MSEQSAHSKYEFKKTLEELRTKKGRGTELISLYIPPTKQISDVTSQLRTEHGQAANIKSKVTRDNVQGALESLLSRLRYVEVPENGIVFFTGAVDIGANKTNMETRIVEPPQPIITYRYHCDSAFFLEPLEEMLKDAKTYGLLVLDRREATVGLLVGKRIEAHRNLTSTVPGKQRKGGQSAHRFQQLRLIAIHDFYKRIGDAASDVFLTIDHKDFEGVLIGGPSPTKEEFESGEFLHHEIQKKVLGLFDVAYTDESGLSELVNAASERLSDLDLMVEKKLMQRFFTELVSDSGKAAYGEAQVRENLNIGAVEILMISEGLRAERLTLKCPNGDYEGGITRNFKPGEEDTSSIPCPVCGSNMELLERVDIVDELSELADQMATQVEFISTDFDEGSQLLNAFGGIVAILRFSTGV
ncbi:peptide chain release factor subunit 1 (aeRF-1) [Methanolobus vulcani]|jgi:peptide chain release factor subunit 1|uniref:Peptide chain release factor subunit 1 n=1 Tax=Methanolobus vulcani TaxID=38026 RepID=A0A7Z7B0U1_9EURY|nr:peptide chain release factor aRF-1 [Methanolobus vulcani]SDG09017.1 peptide chain release factor subunit 1 (aeRF-1) [Methanolobus vulcani]